MLGHGPEDSEVPLHGETKSRVRSPTGFCWFLFFYHEIREHRFSERRKTIPKSLLFTIEPQGRQVKGDAIPVEG